MGPGRMMMGLGFVAVDGASLTDRQRNMTPGLFVVQRGSCDSASLYGPGRGSGKIPIEGVGKLVTTFQSDHRSCSEKSLSSHSKQVLHDVFKKGLNITTDDKFLFQN